MFMEAYSSVGSWADSIIKKTASTIIGEKFTKEALSKQGVSPSEGEGGSPMSTPQAEQNPADLIKEKDKAINSLNKKIANWRAKADYRNSLIKLQQKELEKYQKKEMVGVK